MYWAALVPLSSTASESQIDQQSLGIWALQFSPRVALVEASVLVEVEASARLFHGMDMLRERIEQGACELGARVAWAPDWSGSAGFGQAWRQRRVQHAAATGAR